MDKHAFQHPFFDLRDVSCGEVGDLSVPPVDGHQYLLRVMKEAAEYDDVVTADLSKLKLPNKQPLVIDCGTGLYECPAKFLPSMNLQELQIAQFTEVRQKVARERETEKYVNVSLPQGNIVTWHSFCFGNVGKEAMAPLLKIVLSMNDPRIEKLLEYHVVWLKQQLKMSEVAGKWCYALLASIKIPLRPNTLSTLRDMVRECSRMRSLIECEDDQMLHTYNLLICIIARYFGQLDLADGQEPMSQT